ncbi:MAG: hypothetical protein CM15mP83_0240 [Flavobacteriaceae bacterium]|nr:MAG: hypothetical protein CM15mP83_0240 [Flavobacteriaceae bacterium]
MLFWIPKRPDCNYPFDGLCGCGVVFKLIKPMQAYWELKYKNYLFRFGSNSFSSDIVPILDENGVLTYFGMQVYQQAVRPGLQALWGKANNDQLMLLIWFSGGTAH